MITGYSQQRLFGPTYSQYAAELCNEEVEQIRCIIQTNYPGCSVDELVQMAIKEFPLCVEEDIKEFVTFCISTKQTRTSPATLAMTLSPPYSTIPVAELNYAPAKSPVGNIPAYHNFAQKSEWNTEDPHVDMQSKWTTKEKAALEKYLADNPGRKNWVHCAKLVVTKSSSQCKSKYNNMRAQALANSELEI
ncbi:hypothetical protein BX667DRAFT_494362 [Coemansia mojavensis]|nr:hypothetical protein BX667DRAFT_494362 [Coemansia mojavensis]